MKTFIVSGDTALSVKEIAKDTNLYKDEDDIDYLI